MNNTLKGMQVIYYTASLNDAQLTKKKFLKCESRVLV